jgi:hypothetical protein
MDMQAAARNNPRYAAHRIAATHIYAKRKAVVKIPTIFKISSSRLMRFDMSTMTITHPSPSYTLH